MPQTSSSGMQRIVVAGLEQHFQVKGSGPVCIVHSGGPGIDSSYLRMPQLEDRLTMIYLDPIGTGLSGRLPTHPMRYSVDRFADQLLAFLQALKLDKPYLLGHSHGAFVVLQAALKHPDALAGQILYAGAAYTGGDFMRMAGANIAAFVDRYAGEPESKQVEAAWASIPAIRSDADYTAALRDLLPAYVSDHHRYEKVLGSMRQQLRATMLVGDAQPFDVRDKLESLRVPTLVIAGVDDFILGPRHATVLAEGLPDVEYLAFKRSGHFAHIEEPDAFAEAVGRFTRTPR